ncbi:MAG TPA: hypothetical protein VIT65_22385 [Microlunatus sp.]
MTASPTTPVEFIGIPVLDPDKVKLFKAEYLSYLSDADAAADRGDADAWAEYQTGAAAIEWVLRVLYDNPWLAEEIATRFRVPRSAMEMAT